MARLDEAREQWVRAQWLRFELRMELHRDIPGMSRQLNDLHEFAVRGLARNAESLVGEHRFVKTVELVPMPMALEDGSRAVDLFGERPRCQRALVLAQPHRPAEVVNAKQVAELVDDLV